MIDRKTVKKFHKLRKLYSQILNESALLPLKAIEFKEGTKITAEAIMKTVEEKHFVTDLQLQALTNILTGIKAWTKRRKKNNPTY